MDIIVSSVILAISYLLGLLLKNFLPAYSTKKGENLATKEDISDITRLTEEAKKDFNEKIELYKNNLTVQIEQLKLEQSKMYTNFELYTIKRHECYPEFFKLIEIANGNIRSLQGGIRRSLSFENVDSEDIKIYMEESLFTLKDQSEILQLWNSDKDRAIHLLNYRLFHINYNQALEEYKNANDFFYFNQLYMSTEIETLSKEILEKLHSLWNNYDPHFYLSGVNVGQDIPAQSRDLIASIDSLRETLKVSMRRELLPS